MLQMVVNFNNISITRKNGQVVTDLQIRCNKVVVKPLSGCVFTTVTDFLQVVPTSLKNTGCS